MIWTAAYYWWTAIPMKMTNPTIYQFSFLKKKHKNGPRKSLTQLKLQCSQWISVFNLFNKRPTTWIAAHQPTLMFEKKGVIKYALENRTSP